jgi:hypothetical protein
MKRIPLTEMSVPDLVLLFAKITVAQDEALLGGQHAKFNRLFTRMMEVSNELKNRDDDQRRQLVRLFSFPNMQVRLQAAKLTLAVAPAEARAIAGDRRFEMVSAGWRCRHVAVESGARGFQTGLSITASRPRPSRS